MSSPPVPAQSREVVSSPEAAAAPEVPAPQTLVCANCDAPLSGEYCSSCGQRHEPHVHHLSHFAGEAFESITHADSRLWRTLGYLLVKPGRLTMEFFSGRRARQLPPFRLYLVISLFFFLVAGLSRNIVDDYESPATPESVAALNAAADNLETQMATTPGIESAVQQLRDRAARQQDEIDAGKAAAAGNPIGRQPPGADTSDTAGDDADEAPATKPHQKKAHRDRVRFGFCEGVVDPGLTGSWSDRSMYAYCQKLNKMSGRALLEAMVHNIPKAMFVFLPLLAAFMKLLYWRPKRYYVEHLLFLVHNHAFVFLALGIMILLARTPVIGDHTALLDTAIWLYMTWYIFRAMRVYYGQSRLLTTGKYFVIWFAYVVTSAIVLTGTMFYSTLTL